MVGELRSPTAFFHGAVHHDEILPGLVAQGAEGQVVGVLGGLDHDLSLGAEGISGRV